MRLTTLDPQRPALDLLVDLLTGISGCRLVYEEYVDTDNGDASVDAQFREAVREEARKKKSPPDVIVERVSAATEYSPRAAI